jgi:hypothetical protein
MSANKIAVRIEGEACLAPTFGFLHPYSEHLPSRSLFQLKSGVAIQPAGQTR